MASRALRHERRKRESRAMLAPNPRTVRSQTAAGVLQPNRVGMANRFVHGGSFTRYRSCRDAVLLAPQPMVIPAGVDRRGAE